MENHSSEREYLGVADTAKLVRQALKQEFPQYGARFFAVRSKSYSGGASIRVSWTDGPTTDSVRAVVDGFAGAGFDGMIDMKHYSEAWLSPDGTVSLAHDSGTQSSMGMVPEQFGSRHHPDARLVHFGADFIFCERELSDEIETWVREYRDKNYLRDDQQNDADWDGRMIWEFAGKLTVDPQGEPSMEEATR